MPRDVILVVWFCVCTARTGKQGWGGRRHAGERGSRAAVPSAGTGVGRPGFELRAGPGRTAQRGWVPWISLPCSRAKREKWDSRVGRCPRECPLPWRRGLADARVRGAAEPAHPPALSNQLPGRNHSRFGPRVPHPRTWKVRWKPVSRRGAGPGRGSGGSRTRRESASGRPAGAAGAREGTAPGEGCRRTAGFRGLAGLLGLSPGELQEHFLPFHPVPKGWTNNNSGELEPWRQSREIFSSSQPVFPCYNCRLGIVEGGLG